MGTQLPARVAAGDRTGDGDASGAPRVARATSPKLLQRLDDRSPERAARQAAEDLAAGIDGFSVIFQGAPNAFGHGLPATQEALAAALRDVPLGRTHLRIDVHPQSRASVDWLVRLLATRKIAPERLDISFGIDPAAIFAGTGVLRMSIEALAASMPQSLAHYFVLGVPGVLLEADGRVFHNAGASDAQELGIMLASTVGYLRMFEEARQPAIYAAAHVGFAVSVEQDRLATAAKLAALHQLWERMLASYGVPPLPVAVHAESSYRMMTAAEPETNVVRAVLAAQGAIEAGATTVTALPHDVALRLPDDVARRRVRSALAVLGREGGAHAGLTPSDVAFAERAAQLAEAGWQEMRRIDAEGGILRSLQDGRLQKRILATRDARLAELGRAPHAPPLHRGRREESGDAAAFCQRLDPVRWEEFSTAEAA
ncbi:MAG: methylmalonyl-CoA mutase [Rhizobiaceae bacterium]|nr:methylmalonyl-CoA mutase [Rhizobiaceae bacterium]